MFNKVSIRLKILFLPVISLLLYVALITGEHYLDKKFHGITQESENCHSLALMISEMLNLEHRYINTADKSLLAEIEKKKKTISELLIFSKHIVPEYRSFSSKQSISQILNQHQKEFQDVVRIQQSISRSNRTLYEIYSYRNNEIHNKVDEITLAAFGLLTTGEEINTAQKEFGNALKEFISLDAIASLNTTELYHTSNEQNYISKEKELQERKLQVAKACGALSSVTGEESDRKTWLQITSYQQQIDLIRQTLYDLWKEKKKLTANLPITLEALGYFSTYITIRAHEEISSVEELQKTYNRYSIIFVSFVLVITTYFITKNILNPITELTEVTKKIKEGQKDILVRIKNRDELGTLAATFNDMVLSRKAMRKTLEQNEKRFRNLLESTSTIPWEVDYSSKNFTYIGSQVEEILGYPAKSWTDITVWAERIHPDDREHSVEYCAQSTKRCEDHDFIYRAFHMDGSTVWIHDIVNVISTNGEPVKLIGFMHDITELKKAEEEKKGLEEKLQQSQKMEAIGTLAGGIAHDFNNILGVILGYAEMAKDDAPADSPVANDLDKVLQASYRAKELVKQILAFSRQSAGEKTLFQPSSIVKEAIRMLRSSIPTTILIQDEINPRCDTIYGDPTQLHQVLMNICTNSYHAMEKTGGILEISLNNTKINQDKTPSVLETKDNTFVLLTVKDNGPGIDPTIQDRIFDPYFTTKGTGKGTGMGLSIVHGIVSSFGGLIDFESSPGEGTTFYIYFPASRYDQPESITSETAIKEGSERILLVDDESFLIDMATDMLTRLGYKVTARNSSLDALETFQNQPDQFDLVITDQTMPGMTGKDLARRILQTRPDMPIILCTGFSATISEEKAKAIGIREFAQKPLIKKDLADLIRKVLEK